MKHIECICTYCIFIFVSCALSLSRMHISRIVNKQIILGHIQQHKHTDADKPQLPPRRASANIMYGYVRGTVNITCEAEAEPPATFTWYRDDKELSPKHHFIHTQGHESILQVSLQSTLSHILAYPP